MTRLFLIALLVLSSGPAYAEWVEDVTSDDERITVYVDPDTIRRKGDLVKMWTMYDYKTMQTEEGISIFSYKEQSKYDCVEERHRRLAVTDFSGNMGKGKVVYTNSGEGKWRPVSPGSIGQSLWEVACAKE